MDKIKMRQILEERIIPDLTKNIEQQGELRADILGGQPAAGKSHFIKYLISNNPNQIIINGDDLRSYHPEYHSFLDENEKNASDLSQPAVNFWIENSIKRLSKTGYSMIIEGTMRNVGVPQKTAERLKRLGYFVRLNVVLSHKIMSEFNMLKRYFIQKENDNTARFTNKDSHDEVVDSIYKNIEIINLDKNIDKLNIFRREIEEYINLYKKYYDERIEQTNFLKELLLKEKKRELSDNEIQYIQRDSKWLKKHLDNDKNIIVSEELMNLIK